LEPAGSLLRGYTKATDVVNFASNCYGSAMSTHMQLSENQIRDFQVIRDLGAEALSKVSNHVESLTGTALLNPDKLLSVIKGNLESNGPTADSLMRQALSLNGLMRQTEMSPSEVLAGISAAIERDSDWSPDEIASWDAIEPEFCKLLGLNAFRIAAATIDLSYEYANLFRNGRIITDIRPIFTEDASAIQGAVISFTLRLRFDSVDGGHELSIALDQGDVANLMQQCQRALVKSQTARGAMKNAAIPTIVTGASHNA